MELILYFAIIGLLIPSVGGVEAPDTCFINPSTGELCAPDPLMSPTTEQFRGHDFIWQIPENPKAVLFLAHGARKLPHFFFDTTPSCPACYGLPEERLVVLSALSRGYAVIALSSHDLTWLPHWPPESSLDLPVVHDLIFEWTRNHSLEGLPLFALGSSSGGGFVTILPSRLRLHGVVAICSSGVLSMFEAISPGQYPPLFFVFMNITKNEVEVNLPTKEDTLESAALLKSKGIPVVTRQCSKKQISPAFVRRRIRCMTKEMSENVHRALALGGCLDKNNYLIEDPHSPWRWLRAVQTWNALPHCKDKQSLFLQHDLEEELNVAYAVHTFVSEMNNEIFDWLDSIVAANGHSVDFHRSSL